MGRIFVIVGGLLVLLLTAALVVPPFVDWSGYRAEFEREASRILGRPVQVAGDVKARLLPFPSVAFSDVRVGADPSHPVMSVDTFSMDAELMPFLRGQLLIFDMRVERPNVTISMDKEGRVDWAIRPSTILSPAKISVERLSVRDGTVTLRDDASGREHSIDALNAVLSARTLAGPWQANGTAVFDDQAFALDVSSGEAKPDGSLLVRVRLSPEEISAVFEADGDVQLDDGQLRYVGNFTVRSSDIITQNKNENTGNVDLPFFSGVRLFGSFSADRQRFDVSEFRMEQGPADNPYVVNGKAFVDYGSEPHFEISADGQQIFWGHGENADSADDQSSPAKVPLSERIAIVRSILAQMIIPAMPGTVDLRLPAVVAGGTTIRSVTVQAEPDKEGWNIRQFAADLPGRTKIEAKGRLSVGPDFGFTGDMLVASRQPSGLAAWLNESVDESIRKLDALGFSGTVTLNDHLQQINDLEIGLGTTALKGSFLRQSDDRGQPVVTLQLTGGAVESEALRAVVGLFADPNGISLLEEQAVDLSFQAGPVRYHDMEAGNVDVALRINNGRFDFDRLMISDIAGATLTATGAIEPYASMPAGKLDATILSDDLSQFFNQIAHSYPQLPFFRALSERAANYPGLFEDTEINILTNAVSAVKAASETNLSAQKPTSGTEAGKGARTTESIVKAPAGGGELSFSLTGKSGGMKLDLSGLTSGASSDSDPMQMQVNGTASSMHGEAVLALLGLPAMPLGLAGELNADLTMQGAPSAGMRTQLTLTSPDGKAVVDGILSMVGHDVAASGKALLQAADMQPFIATAGFTLPGFGQGLPVDLKSDFQFAKGVLRFPNLNGKLAGEDISARIDANFADSGVPQLKGEAKLASLELDSLAVIMLGQDALVPGRTDKKSIWPHGAIAMRPLLPMSLDIKLNAAKAHLSDFGTITDFSTRLQKEGGELTLNEMSGSWGGGYVVGNVSLRNNDGNALLATTLKWNGAELAEFYRPSDRSAPFDGVMKAELTLNGSGDTMADLVGSLAGSVNLGVQKLTVHGLNSTVFAEMIVDAEAIGDKPAETTKPDDKQFDIIASKVIDFEDRTGEFRVDNALFDFSVAGGVARLSAFNLCDANACLTGDLMFDLSNLALSGNSTFRFKGKEGAELGIMPQTALMLGGTFDAPLVEIDQQPLVQFLTQHALEREQERVEAMQAALLEKQRLRRQLDLFSAEALKREEAKQEQIRQEELRKEQIRQQEEEKRKAAQTDAPLRNTNLDNLIKELEKPVVPMPVLPEAITPMLRQP